MTHPATPPVQEAPRWRRRKDARPNEIIRAALDVFIRQGFAATRVQDIARQAGITIGTLYLYFPSKEALFHAAVAHAMTPVLAFAEDRVSSHHGAAEPRVGARDVPPAPHVRGRAPPRPDVTTEPLIRARARARRRRPRASTYRSPRRPQVRKWPPIRASRGRRRLGGS